MLTRRTLLRGAAAILAAPALSRPVHAQTHAVTDALGRSVTVKSRVERVVVTFNYEEFTAIAGTDAWARVVGISRAPWESWRPAIFRRYAQVIPNLTAMPDVGHTDDNTFSAERVIALRPDVVLMPEWAFNGVAPIRDQIIAAGIPVAVIDYNAQTLARHMASARVTGQIMGTPERGEALAVGYERGYADIQARVARVASRARPKVHVELAQAGPGTIGNSYNGTMWGKILTTIGAQNIAEGRLAGPWGPLPAEAIIASNPDFIFMAGSSWLSSPNAVRTGYDADADFTRRTLAPYAARPWWAAVTAVRNGEIHAIEHGLCRTLFDYTATQYIARRLYPEVFADVDPIASLREYHERYLPVAFAGTWMLPLRS